MVASSVGSVMSNSPSRDAANIDAVDRAILTDEPAVPSRDAAAVVAAFRIVLPELPTLSKAEVALLDEWLRR